ncbi:MAG: lipid A biosynthesis acyltransferase [Arhodomonas sp.]|nr:lipid A biosynthesis acyltransferase [Arhodomonas sp.]
MNVELCFPELGAAAKRHLARRTLQASACNLLELGPLWYRPLDDTLALIREVKGETLLSEAREEGHGVLIIAPHLGAWELYVGGATHPPPRLHRRDRPGWKGLVAAARRAPAGPASTPPACRGSGRCSRPCGPARRWASSPTSSPRKRACCGVLRTTGENHDAIRQARRRSRRAGRRRLGRTPAGEQGYRLHWRRVDAAVGDPDPLTAARALNRAIEDAVREHPEQYLWTYRRFSRQPASP